MIGPPTQPGDFFVAGGTLRSGAQSYVTRPADTELLAATLAGEFCYVLTPRQMGKSSLMVRTARELQAQGVSTVILDLTSIGTAVTVEQWYLGLLTRVNSRLNRTFDLTQWWAERAHLGVVQRFTDYLREVLLQVEQQVVIFIDEIDTTLSLDFRDDFFAAIRYFYNMRSDEPGLEKLSIALLGVATPADLIRDRTRTPFNIGRRIELHEFSRSDARLLEQELETLYPGKGAGVFDRIFYWTNGHPYLTQKLCLAAAENEACTGSPDEVDELVHDLFLSEAARRETNLQFIRDNITGRPPKEQRRLLHLYRDVLNDKHVVENERSAAQNRLKLIGLVKGDDRVLHVRNNIYRAVFDRPWIRETSPTDWNRRIAVGALVALLITVAVFAFSIWTLNRRALERVIEEEVTRFETGNLSVRLDSLGTLYSYGAPETSSRAEELYHSLPAEEREALFLPGVAIGLDSSLRVVAIAVYRQVDESSEDETSEHEAVLQRMAATMKASNNEELSSLGVGLDQWMEGRLWAGQKKYLLALNAYDAAERSLSINPSPGLFFDRAVAHAELGQVDEALALLDSVAAGEWTSDGLGDVALPAWRERVTAYVIERPELLARWSAGPDAYQALAAILPTPTALPTSTATPVVSLTPSLTPPPTATAEPSATPAPSATATPASPTGVTAQQNANLHAGPGLEYPLIVQAPGGAEMDIIGRTESGEWINVLYLGQRVWISSAVALVSGALDQIEVVATVPPPPSPTFTVTARVPTAIPPTATPSATVTPTPTTRSLFDPFAPSIVWFEASPAQVTVGQCVRLDWNVVHLGVPPRIRSSLVTISNQFRVILDLAPMRGSIEDCTGGQPTTIEYRIRAYGNFGFNQALTYVRVVGPGTATVTPTATPDQPVIDSFLITPGQLQPGQCVQISWSTSGTTSLVRVLRNNVLVLDNAPLTGSDQDCLRSAGSYTYQLVAGSSGGVSVSRDQTVLVTEALLITRSSPTVTPQATATPSPTVRPEATVTPSPTVRPPSTATPSPTVRPPTATPSPTVRPPATATPQPTSTLLVETPGSSIPPSNE